MMKGKLIVYICIFFLCSIYVSFADENWKTIAPGMELGVFKVNGDTKTDDSSITILRINPNNWELSVLSLTSTGESDGLSASEWCKKYKLTAAINAGMFAEDYSTHVGYMKCKDHVNCSKVNQYKSAAAFSPKVDNIPYFRIFDLDVTKISTIEKQYDCIVQNLRLIKHPRENRWSQQQKKWSEAALGEDKSGRILFILCRKPYSMHDLNKILLDLPIDLVCAQHLEGGPEAQIYIKVGETELELNGSYETGFNENNSNKKSWPIPNVIGVKPQDD